MLLLPDLVGYELTGRAVAEYTNATTTQAVAAATGEWDRELLARLGLPAAILPEIVPAGTDLGPLRPSLAAALGLAGVRVVAPATHDTGSAVAGAPLEESWAYISSGTWSLVGVELERPLIDARVAASNFTNEGGAFGTIRFLKNVMGLWIFESCRREWEGLGLEVDYAALLGEAARIEDFQGFIYPDDARFLNPDSMLGAIAEQLAENGTPAPPGPAALTKIILDSLAFRYASLIRTIEELTGRAIEGVQIVGGGGRNDYLNQMTANACGKIVKAGPTEATVAGNALVQAIAAGRFADLKEARAFVKGSIQVKRFAPRRAAALEKAAAAYAALEARFAA